MEWKPQSVTKDKTRALAVAYVTNRAIMERLDAVCGPGGWQNIFAPTPNDPKGASIACGISIKVGDEWVTKWDAAENTAVEPIKGGYSASMKRAASQWGIGRYLYNLESAWVPFDGRRMKETPKVPKHFLPCPVSAFRAFHATGQQTYGAEWDKKRRELVTAITDGRTTSSRWLSWAEVDMLIDGMRRNGGSK